MMRPLLFEVEDDGIGIDPGRLAMLQRDLAKTTDVQPTSEAGFGLFNVNSRLKLYYGGDYGLTLESRQTAGTHIRVFLPLRLPEREPTVHTRSLDFQLST